MGDCMTSPHHVELWHLKKTPDPLLSKAGFNQSRPTYNLLKPYARDPDSELRSPGRAGAVQDPILRKLFWTRVTAAEGMMLEVEKWECSLSPANESFEKNKVTAGVLRANRMGACSLASF